MAVPKSVLLALMLAMLAAADTSQESIFNEVKKIKTVITLNNEITYVPPMMIIGLKNGSIMRCPHAKPTSCEVYHVGNSPVTATVVHGEYLFASLASGDMLRCRWHKTHSCSVFHQARTEITGLGVMAGFLHAGLRNGTILRCDLNIQNNCWTFAKLETGKHVRSLITFGASIYAGSDDGRIDRCSETGCQLYCVQSGSDITGLAVIGHTVYGVREGGVMNSGAPGSNRCDQFAIPGSAYRHMTVYGRKLYVVQDSSGIYIVDQTSHNRSAFAMRDGVVSISFAYGTYAMQNQYGLESKKCIWRGIFECPPTVVYYEAHQRFTFEVLVENGSLYNSQGALVDTSNADDSYGQKAAIFVLGPDGQLLLSNFHKTGLLHTSSLLAGNPVSGAGFIVVEHGKIKSITACSVHYRPDPELNNQVIEALYLKGYTDPIDTHPCSYNSMVCVRDSTNIGNLY